MGVFDGHGGGSCAQVLAKRLFHYITASLLPPPLLQQYLQDLQDGKHTDLINSFNDKVQLVEDIAGVYKDSFLRFIHDLNNVSISIINAYFFPFETGNVNRYCKKSPIKIAL